MGLGSVFCRLDCRTLHFVRHNIPSIQFVYKSIIINISDKYLLPGFGTSLYGRCKAKPIVLRTVGDNVSSFRGRQHADDVVHKPSSRLSLLSAMPKVTFPVLERHCPWLVPVYKCLCEQRHVCERFA